LDIQGQIFQVTYVSPIADVQKLDCVLNLNVFLEKDLKRVPDFNENFVFGQCDVFNNGDLCDVDPFNEDFLKFKFQAERELKEDLEQVAVFALFPFCGSTS